MIDESTFYGGSKHVSSGSVANVLWRGSPRVVVVESGSTGNNINMWQADRSDERGGPYHIIINRSGRTLYLYDLMSGISIGSPIPNNESAAIMLADSDPDALPAGQWRVVNLVPPLSAYVGTRSNPQSFDETYPLTCVDPACLDECEDFLDLDPSGIVVPMFQNSAAAINATREPIRGADVQIPKELGIAFERGTFVEDQNHPNYSTLSQQLHETLFGIEGEDPVLKWHILTYGGSIPGNSRHWHHIRYTGTMGTPGTYAWTLPAPFNVRRHYWKKTLNYTRLSDNTAYTIEIRVVMEHSVNPEPVAGSTPASGKNNATEGSWGTLFNVYVFCDEAAPSYVDGTNFTPNGWTGSITFTKNDPVAWGGNYSAQGGTSAHKVCHPKMVICASVPTTMESPAGFLWHADDQDRVHYCQQRSAGIPWTSPTISALGTSIWNNGVFGVMSGSFSHGCMTLGGDVPYSIPMDWIVVENSETTPGHGTGFSFFCCTKPGWDEQEGVLDLLGGTAVKLCILPQKEDQNPVNVCEGHEDELFENIGGTHRCFMSAVDQCCMSIMATDELGTKSPAIARMTLAQTCTRQTLIYGEFDGTGCPLISSQCRTLGEYTTGFSLDAADYTYMMGGNQLNREIRYSSWFDDPSSTKFDFTYLSTDPNIQQRVGTATFASTTITVATVNTAKTYSNVVTYDPVGSTHSDVLQKVTVPLSASYTAGMLLRGSVDGSFNLTGYTTIFNKTADTVTIYRVSAGTETQLAQYAAAGIGALSSIAAEFECEGSTIVARWGSPIKVLEVDHCDNTNGGEPGVVTRGSATGAVFTPTSPKWIDDKTIDWLEVHAKFSPVNCSTGTFHSILLRGYGKCESNDNTDCGTSPNCNCTTWQDTRYDPTLPSGCVENTEVVFNSRMPTYVYGRCYEEISCDPDVPVCGECPPTRMISSVVLPGCVNPDTGESVETVTNPAYCGGSQKWSATYVSCA
jgi:hypothetical protein